MLAVFAAGASVSLAASDVINIPAFGPSTGPTVDTNGAADTAPTLKIGDPAPKLSPGKWIQGGPLTNFDSGHSYLVEFWTLRGTACREAIPQLNDIYTKYKAQNLIVIGQDCGEDEDDLVGPFVAQMSNNLSYPVALDNSGDALVGQMADNWLGAAGEETVPTAFLVDSNGVIAWIGRPRELKDSMIDDLLAGKFDIKKAGADYAQKKLNEQTLDRLGDKLDEALQASDWDAANALLADMQKLMPSDQTNGLDMVRFGVLLGKKQYPDAYKLAQKISDDNKDDVRLLDKLAWGIATDPSIESRDLDLAEKIATRGNEVAKGQDPSVLDTMARLRFMKGKPDEAIRLEQQAMAVAGDDQKDEFQKTLDAYKKGELPKDDAPAPTP